MKKRKSIYPFIVMGFVIIIANSCHGNDPAKPTNPTSRENIEVQNDNDLKKMIILVS